MALSKPAGTCPHGFEPDVCDICYFTKGPGAAPKPLQRNLIPDSVAYAIGQRMKLSSAIVQDMAAELMAHVAHVSAEKAATIDNGGPAFPSSHQNPMNGHPTVEMAGMSLRDWYAGKALENVPHATTDLHDRPSYREEVARHCWRMADAMIATRGGKS